MKDNYSWLDDVAKYIYEATRVEAEWSKRPIVPELWENRDDKFRKQFVDIIAKYMSMDKLPTPAEAHESWNQSYYKMGWKYGEVRDVEAKTHPDLLPFDELSQPERDKDAIFLAFVWLATQLQSQIEIEKLRARIDSISDFIIECYDHDNPMEIVTELENDRRDLTEKLKELEK